MTSKSNRKDWLGVMVSVEDALDLFPIRIFVRGDNHKFLLVELQSLCLLPLVLCSNLANPTLEMYLLEICLIERFSEDTEGW